MVCHDSWIDQVAQGAVQARTGGTGRKRVRGRQRVGSPKFNHAGGIDARIDYCHLALLIQSHCVFEQVARGRPIFDSRLEHPMNLHGIIHF